MSVCVCLYVCMRECVYVRMRLCLCERVSEREFCNQIYESIKLNFRFDSFKQILWKNQIMSHMSYPYS